MKVKLLLIGFVFLFFSSCHKDEKQAQRSFEGTWNVTALEANYGEFSGGCVSIDSSIPESNSHAHFLMWLEKG